MEFHWIWKGILIVLFGSIILRIAGRKSISQMTVSQTVIMISIGTLLIQPVSEKNIWITFLICALLILTLIVIEYVQMKTDGLECFFSGHAIVIIENGKINIENVKKIRLPVDKLEMRLRQKNVQRMKMFSGQRLKRMVKLVFVKTGFTVCDEARYSNCD